MSLGFGTFCINKTSGCMVWIVAPKATTIFSLFLKLSFGEAGKKLFIINVFHAFSLIYTTQYFFLHLCRQKLCQIHSWSTGSLHLSYDGPDMTLFMHMFPSKSSPMILYSQIYTDRRADQHFTLTMLSLGPGVFLLLPLRTLEWKVSRMVHHSTVTGLKLVFHRDPS